MAMKLERKRRGKRKMSKFTQLACAHVNDKKDIVISLSPNNRISIAQQIFIDDDGRTTGIFMKNAITLNIDSIYELKSAIEESIVNLEKILKSEEIE